MSESLAEIKEEYSLLWRNWYYMPFEYEKECEEAKRLLDECGQRLNEASSNERRVALAKAEGKETQA